MTRPGRALVPTLLVVSLVAIAHDLLAMALDRLGLVERLLSPSGIDAIGALLGAIVLFSMRLGLVFAAPPLVAGLACLWLTRPDTRPDGDGPA